ncbi:MAG: DNA recombination protein RmuC [Flavobacteriaceae bacterium]
MDMILLVVLLLVLALLVLVLFRLKGPATDQMADAFRLSLQQEFSLQRSELSKNLKENREELTQGINQLTELIRKNAKDDRDEVRKTLQQFQEAFTQNVNAFNTLQKQKFEQMALKQDELAKTTELRLEKMRATVDEKLHKTLEDRLGKSFERVTKQLLEVQKGLGEMQNLATGVGDLKRVLTNVKTRGVLGEIQLGNILEQILAPEQYEANVKTKPQSDAIVEFAIRLPGKQQDKPLYLPIDAKFPQEDYVRLQTAYELGDPQQVEVSQKALMRSVKSFAKDISQKYLEPPYTTDFGIMFLPTEGLYAELARFPDLIAQLQREHKIILTGPTTLAAMLNSLQMGFKTLAIQKRSSEVWQVLGAVKKEFVTFGGVLEKAQKKIKEADTEIEKMVTTRTKMMLSKLKKVEKIEPENIDTPQPPQIDLEL